jgi:phage I-like protein
MPRRLALCFELPTGSAPDKVQLIPAPDAFGIVRGRDGRNWVWDADAQQSVLAAHAERAVDIVIDRNHSTELRAPKGDESPAAGWLKTLEVRADGSLWAPALWTPRGRNELEANEYRYLSPVFDYDPQSGRIARLVSVGLTNKPNLHLQALNQESPMKLAAAICAALGLAATATEDEGVTAIAKLKGDLATASNSQQPSLDRFVPRSDYDAVVARANNAEQQLVKRDADAHKAAVDAAIDAATKAGKISPGAVDYHRASCSDQAGLERFQKFVGAAPVIAPDTDLDKKKADASNTALNADEKRVCELMGITSEQFIASRKARATA